MHLQLLLLLQIPLIFCLTLQEEVQPFLTSLAKHLKLQDFSILHDNYYKTLKNGINVTRDGMITSYKQLNEMSPPLFTQMYDSFKNPEFLAKYWNDHIVEKTAEGFLKIKSFKNNKLESYTLAIYDAKIEGKYKVLRDVEF